MEGQPPGLVGAIREGSLEEVSQLSLKEEQACSRRRPFLFSQGVCVSQKEGGRQGRIS